MNTESPDTQDLSPSELNEFQINLRDLALGICKRFNNQEITEAHLIFAILQSLERDDSNRPENRERLEFELESLAKSIDGKYQISNEFEHALRKVGDFEQASAFAKTWLSLPNEDASEGQEIVRMDSESEDIGIDSSIHASEKGSAVTSKNQEVTLIAPLESVVKESQVAAQFPVASSLEEPISESLNRQKKLSERQIELLAQNQKVSNKIDEYESEIDKLRGILEDLNQWRGQRQRSFAWKLVRELKAKASKLETDEEKLKEFVSKELAIDQDFSVKTRQWVVRSVIGNFLVTSAIMFIIWIVFSNYSSIVNSLRSIEETPVIGAVSSLVLMILTNFSGPSLVGLVLLTALLSFMLLLFSYSRKISRYSQELHELSELMRTMEKATDHVAENRAKINSLYPQIPQLLELYSMVLHDPLRIDEKYRDFSTTFPDTSNIPESLELAAPTEESVSNVFEELVLRTLSQEIQTLGWRYEALRLTLGSLTESMGMGKASEALTTIDQDQRRSGTRQLIINQHESVRDPILKAIGDERVKWLAKLVQERVLPQVQPNVKSLRPDPLGHLELFDEIGAGKQTQVSSWQEKLVEAAGMGFPWSAGNFSNIGQTSGKHLEPIESFFISSKQVSGLSHPQIKKYPLVDPGSRPFEVSIRVDLSSWCKPGDLAIFDGLEASVKSDVESAESSYSDFAKGSETDLVY